MAKKPETQEGAKSIHDIAATLVGPQQKAAEVVDPDLGDDEEVVDEILNVDDDNEDEEDQSPTGGEQEGADEDDDDASDTDDTDNEVDGDDQIEFLDIRDDDLLTVVVDGEEREVTIGELKKAHSGEGAIDKRLQEATEARKEAMARGAQMLETLAAEEANLTEALNSLDDNLFKGMIPEPDDRLRRSDPERYLRHKDAYEAEQKRIADGRNAIKKQIDTVKQNRQTRLAEFAKEAAEVIVKEIPELADPQKSADTYKSLAQTAMSYGYSEAEVQSAVDPRMFALVRDAMRYRQMTDKARERDPKDLTNQGEKRVRRLRSGNTTAKTKVRQADKQRKQMAEKARQTGKVKDVAATLLVSKKG